MEEWFRLTNHEMLNSQTNIMRRIIYVYGNLPAYREQFFTQLSSRLKEEGIEMKVMYGLITNKLTSQALARKYSTKRFETKLNDLKFLRFSRMLGLCQAVKEEKPDAVIFQFNQTNLSEWEVLRFCKRNKIPYGIWGCNYTRSDLNGWLVKLRNLIYKYIYRNASICIPYGSIYRDYLISLGVPADKVIVAQNSIDVESISRGVPCRTPDSFEHKTTRILYVGALAPQKRIESSIDAVAQLIDEGIELVYDIVGGGAQFDIIKNHILTKSDKANQSIILHGAMYGEELRKFFLSSDVFLMPGTGGLGVNEAMAYGLPIISTMGDETVVDLLDGNGYLLEKMGDSYEQMSAIRKYISLSAEEKAEMSKKSTELIINRASLQNMVMKHVEACKKLIVERNDDARITENSIIN